MMRKTLHSINGLAVELNRDRRTLARALSGVRPDGDVGGHEAWFIATASRALDRVSRGGVPDEPDPMAERIEARLDRKVRPDSPVLDMREVADLFGAEPADVVLWMKAGAPYVEPGDPVTGEGARLRPAAVMDWSVLIADRLASTGNDRLAERLRLPC